MATSLDDAFQAKVDLRVQKTFANADSKAKEVLKKMELAPDTRSFKYVPV